MTNKVVKYKLNADGTHPHNIHDGGYYGKPNGGTPPQYYDFIGLTNEGNSTHSSAETFLGELASEAAVKSYLDTYASGWKETVGITSISTKTFDTAVAAADIWGKRVV